MRDNHASLLYLLGRRAEAPAERHAILDIESRDPAAVPKHAISVRSHLIATLFQEGKYAEALGEMRVQVLTQSKVLGPAHAEAVVSRMALGELLLRMGKSAEAEEQYRLAAEARAQKLGAEHADTIAAREAYSGALEKAGKYEEFLAQARLLLETRTKTLGPTAEHTLATHNALATALDHLNREAEREKEARGVLAAAEGVLEPSNRVVWVARRHVIESTKQPDNFEATVAGYRSLLTDDQTFLGPADLETLAVQQNLLAMLYAAHKPLDTEEIKKTVASHVSAQGVGHPDVQSGRWLLVSALMRANKFGEAEPILRELLAWNEKAGGDLLEPWLFLGLCLGNNGKVEEGLAYAHKAREGYRSATKPDEARVAKATEIIDQLEAALNAERSKARGMKRSIVANEGDKPPKSLTDEEKYLGPEALETLSAGIGLAVVLMMGESADAVPRWNAGGGHHGSYWDIPKTGRIVRFAKILVYK